MAGVVYMISLIQLILLLHKPSGKGETIPKKLPDAEYLDVGVWPTILLSKIYFKDSFQTENIIIGVSPTIILTQV